MFTFSDSQFGERPLVGGFVPIANKLTDRYQVKQTLGQGCVGLVYWAYDTRLGRDVAVKTIREAPDPAALDRFYKECETLASFRHPNIIEILDLGKFQDDGIEKPYLVMPLLKGVTLDSLIRATGNPLAVERTVDILCQTCRGLQAAHVHGLVHGDLKPRNIFVLEDASVKIIDFGFARLAGAYTASTPKDLLFYLSPEQIQLKPASALSDIFSLGIVAYQALTRRRPFDGATQREVAAAILQQIPPPASDLNPAVSPLLGRVVHKALEKQPGNRFSTAQDLDEALQKALQNGPIEAVDAAKLAPAPATVPSEDAELDQLALRMRHGQERTAAAQALVDQGRAFCVHGRFEQAVNAFRKAYEKDERDLAIRLLLVDTLVQHARSVLGHNWKFAGELLQAALKVDPLYVPALSLTALVADRKRDEAVDRCLSRASQLQTTGDVAGALASVDELLASYPTATRLVQFKAALQRSAIDGTAAGTRRADLEKLAALQALAATTTDVEKQRKILADVRGLAARYLDDQEFQSALVAIEKRYVSLERSPVPPPPAPVPPRPAAPDPPAPLRPVAPVPPPPPEEPAARNWKFWGAFAASFGVIVALGFGFVWWQQRSPNRPKAPAVASTAAVAVDIKTVPEGATLAVNDKPSGVSNLQLKLEPGTYRISAVREGYRPAQSTLTVTAGLPASANIPLEPLPTTLRLLTDLDSAPITLDGKPQPSLQSGQFILDSVGAGSHVLTIGSAPAAVAVRFDSPEGSPPVVTGVDAAKETSAILIANLGTRARIYSSQKTGGVVIDGKPSGNLDQFGVDLTTVGSGDHEITIGQGDERHKVVYQTTQTPALTIYLNSLASNQPAVGTLLITTGEDDVQVTVDGKPLRTPTRRGQLRIPNLPPKQYTIAVSKDGFQPVTEQRVTIKKGDEAKVAFQLHPLPAIATLRLPGGIPGTQVLVDGKVSGTVGPDGALPALQVAPGAHSVQLRKDEYRPKTFQLNFGAGKEVTLSGADAALESTFGILAIAVTPPGAQVTVQRAGDPQSHPITGNSTHLPEGSYTVSATAPHFLAQSTTVEIAAGSTRNVTLQLAAEHVAPVAKTPPRLGMSGWQLPGAWQPEGDHFTRKGGNVCLFTPQGSGTYAFTATMKRGKQLRWVAHYINDKNYVEFEIDNDNFYRRQVVNGKTRDLLKRKHGLTMDSAVSASVQVVVSSSGILQKLKRPDGWVTLDSWQDPALHEGRFGFLIRGHDEVNLFAFWFAGSE